MQKEVEKIRELTEKDQEEAEKTVRAMETVSVRDPEFHLSLAELCEELGIIEKIPAELLLTLRDAPENTKALKKLASFYRDSHSLAKAEKYLRKLIEINPEETQHYEELWNLLEEKKDPEALEGLSQKLRELFPGTKLASLSVNIEKEEEIRESLPEKEEISLIPSETQLARFVSLFSGREGVYARQWISPTGESGYTPVKEPFNYIVAKNHILGNYTAGIYQLRMDNTVNFIAFDIDITKKYLSRIMSEKKLWKGAIRDAHRVACKIIDILSAADIPVYLESSGYKGRHCWIFTEVPLSAKIAKAFASSVKSMAGEFPEGIEVEIFPKQEYVKTEGYGNLIKIPLGIHRKTGRKSLFIDPLTGKAYEDQLSLLENFRKCPKEKILDFARQHIAVEIKEEKKAAPEEEPLPVIKSIDTEYDIEGDKEFQYMLLKCEVIKYLYDKIKEYSELTNDEIVILSHTAGHLSGGPEAVNYLLKLCPGISDHYYLKSCLRGNPVSCAKIRKKIPAITSKLNCNCKFENYADMYPTPVLHVNDLKNPALSSTSSLDTIQFQMLVQEYLKTRKELQRLHETFKKQKGQLDRFFDEAEITSIQTSLGTLKKVSDTEGKTNYILEI